MRSRFSSILYVTRTPLLGFPHMGVRIQYLILAFFFSLTACSLYQSKGRKFLEDSAYEFAKVSAYAVSCGQAEFSNDWQELKRTDQTVAYELLESDSVHLQITNLTSSRSCAFTFNSEKQMQKYLDQATEYTLLNFSLGEFAFRH